jgi:hypothetical protein
MATAGRGVVAIPPDEPITVVGAPGALRISLPLVNSGSSPLVIRDAAIRNVVAREGNRPLVGIGASLTAVLSSGQTSQGQLRLQLDPHTPPGDYVGEIEIAGSTHPLTLTIVERVRLSIDPDPIHLEGAAGSVVRKTVLFRNLGNVPLHVRAGSAVRLGEELPFAPTTMAEIATAGRTEDAIRKLLGTLFERRHTRLLKENGAMPVRLVDGDFTLAPGESEGAVIECTLPDDLVPHRRYRAYAPIYDADLAFVIVTTEAERAMPKPRTDRTKPRRSR